MSIRTKLQEFYTSHKRMPSYAELADLAGFASKQAAYSLARRLQESELVSRDNKGKLLPGRRLTEVMMLGLVQAGFPTHVEDEIADTMSIDDYLIDNRSSSFLLTVKGDSMKDAGIVEGDLVLVERGREPRVGDIVIAEVDGEWTMKYYRKRGHQIILEPANKRYKPILPNGQLKIAAVVKGVVRRY